MDQSARLKMLAAFRNNEVTYLIASDVAARGLDIPEVSHVFNFDVPIHAEDYVHRVGRTGRAGREGHAFTMVTREEAKYLRAIEHSDQEGNPLFRYRDGGRQRRSAGKGTPGAARRQKAKPSPGEACEPESRRYDTRRCKACGCKTSRRKTRRRKAGAAGAASTPARAAPGTARARHLEDAPESGGFHSGNMPAFLLRK